RRFGSSSSLHPPETRSSISWSAQFEPSFFQSSTLNQMPGRSCALSARPSTGGWALLTRLGGSLSLASPLSTVVNSTSLASPFGALCQRGRPCSLGYPSDATHRSAARRRRSSVPFADSPPLGNGDGHGPRQDLLGRAGARRRLARSALGGPAGDRGSAGAGGLDARRRLASAVRNSGAAPRRRDLAQRDRARGRFRRGAAREPTRRDGRGGALRLLPASGARWELREGGEQARRGDARA